MKIQNKLFLILFSFSFLLVTILVLLMQWSIGKGMVNYVNTKEIEALKPVVVKLIKEYKIDNNWQSMVGRHGKFIRLISDQLIDSEFSPKQQKRPPEHRPFRRPPPKSSSLDSESPPPRDDMQEERFPPREHEAYYALLDNTHNVVVGKYIDDIEYSETEVIVGNVTVGYFAVSKRNQLTQGYEVEFIEQQQYYLWVIALLAMSLVTLVTLPLARHVVEPIKLITHGMHKLTQGNYKQSINLNRKDELGQLSRDYNELAHTLAENETARKRWLANISHELRTPIAILRGELEAMLDEVRPLNKTNIASANDEVKHLQRLIDDLNLLTSADIGGMRYRKKNEELTAFIHSVVDKYRSYLLDAGISLELEIINQDINVYIDTTRLCQSFENIINNAIKYSSATQLKISLSIEKNSTALIKFEDDGVGVEDVHLIHLFEHLYRIEDSRNRKTGGSGLGLSICRHIIMAHQGEISAENSPLGGLAIIIKLPVV
jgi:two-component system sensor histidine kinase BaeS